MLCLADSAGAAALPDGRAYELVSPPDTGSSVPGGGPLGQDAGTDCFETSLATPDGEQVAFASEGSSLPGFEANGGFNLYEAHRTSSGWLTESKSATGKQSSHPSGGLCLSPDHQVSTFLTGFGLFDSGSLVINGEKTSYLRMPDGSYVPVGVGTTGTEPSANIRRVGNDGGHAILTARVQLEPEAPAEVGPETHFDEGLVGAIYDRTPVGLNVVSLLPSGLAPDPSTETTYYRGATTDAETVVFEVEKSGGSATLYLHQAGATTLPVVTSSTAGEYLYAGVSSNGRKVTYMKTGPSSTFFLPRGDISVFDAATEESLPVITGHEAALVNISDDGTTVYFTSQDALAGTGPNPLGEEPLPGESNLYQWVSTSEATSFIATVAPEDVEEGPIHEKLTEWMHAVARPQQDTTTGRANDSSRTTADGSVFLFQAHGDITGYDPDSFSEIYRYDGDTHELACVSCPPVGEPATADAFLQRQLFRPIAPTNAITTVQNMSEDGVFTFFMTGQALSGKDVNENVDVYEWHEGSQSLISSGTSSLPSILYATPVSGRDVFFETADQLVPQDTSPVPSIYDARIGGGFPPPPSQSPPCKGDECQGAGSGAQNGSSAGSASAAGPGNPKPQRNHRCKKAKGGKHRKHCPKRHRRAKHHHTKGGRR